KILQDEYGAKLYCRLDSGGISLTEEGQAFVRHVNVFLAETPFLKKRTNDGSVAQRSKPLIVGASYGLSSPLLPSLLALFKKSHPDVRVTLRTHSTRHLEQLIVKRRIDLAVIPRAPVSAHIMAEPYVALEVACIAAPDYPIKRDLSLPDLAATHLIIRSEQGAWSTTEIILRKLREEGYKPNIAMRCDSPEAVKTSVRKRLGVGILFRDAVKASLKRGDFKTLRIPWLEPARTSFIIYSKDRLLSANAEAFLNFLRRSKEKKERIKSVRSLQAPAVSFFPFVFLGPVVKFLSMNVCYAA
ncbi:MAG: hypothetical protein HY695_27715, partial [Deltaproteobacteria bacterium]|nr:hypothetical protein [Deltaproteobacteria bacterium]